MSIPSRRPGARGSPDEALDREEVLLTRLSRVAHYLRPPASLPPLANWISQRTITRLGRDLLTGGNRALGRLALVDNYRAIANRLGRALDRITAPEALQQPAVHSGLGWRSNWPRVYLVASLAGGTGSGMFIDLAYIVRAALRQRGYGRAEMVGLTFLPTPADIGKPPPGAILPQANAYAALVELLHFASYPFRGEYETTTPPVENAGPPFNRLILLTGEPQPAARLPRCR